MDNTEKFTGKADAYEKSRPDYPKKFIDFLTEVLGVNESSVIADIGSGTGKLTKNLLEIGGTVYGVEPNEDMRRRAEAAFAHNGRFISVPSPAESTTLSGHSVDLITAAQSFHWFDKERFREECIRILKPGGRVVLVWNSRDKDSEFVKRQFEIFKKFCPGFSGFSGGGGSDEENISAFFNGRFEKIFFPNDIALDRDRFINRSLSASYSLKSGDADFDAYVTALENCFSDFEENGTVIMPNITRVYYETLA